MDNNEATFWSSATQKVLINGIQVLRNFQAEDVQLSQQKEASKLEEKKKIRNKSEQSVKPILKKERNIDQFELSNQ
jgi:hypothetical protein